MAALKDKLEAERARLFPLWKAALEAADGNVTRAAAACKASFDPLMTRHKGNRLTRRFELVAFAAELRVKATGRAMGRGVDKKPKSK